MYCETDRQMDVQRNMAVIRNQVHDKKSAARSRVKSAATEAAAAQHQLSSIGSIVNFWTPPKSQGGHLQEKYFDWHN